MTAAAGFTLLHLGHTETLVAGTRQVKAGMTILAAVGGDMGRMAENSAAGPKLDIFYRMTLLTIRFDAKGCFAVMTSSAGSALFHVSH